MIIKRILLSIFIFMFSGVSYSALLEYKFTGTVSGYTDNAGIIASTPYDLSKFVNVQTVEYVFQIDFDAYVEFTLGNSSLKTITDTDFFS